MDDASIDVKRAARDAAYAMPLEEINPGDNELFRTDTHWPYFERLRARVKRSEVLAHHGEHAALGIEVEELERVR